MSAAKPNALARTLAGAALLAALAVPAYAQEVSEVDVRAGKPTSVALRIADKAPTEVRKEIRVAAATVCRNAVSNQELDLGDFSWCRFKTKAKALVAYDDILSGRTLTADAGAIVLSAR